MAYAIVNGILAGGDIVSALRETSMTSIIRSSLASLALLSFHFLPYDAAQAENCVIKAGSATGFTRGMAEYESLLIIRQVTGNWPFETDRIGKPAYTCKQDGALWSCRAVAKVCKS